MSGHLDTVIVGVAVAAALLWAGRAAWRTWRQQGVCSSCGSSGDCPVAGNPEALTELSEKGQLNHLDSCQPGAMSCQDLARSLADEPTDPSPTHPRKTSSS